MRKRGGGGEERKQGNQGHVGALALYFSFSPFPSLPEGQKRPLQRREVWRYKNNTKPIHKDGEMFENGFWGAVSNENG